MIFQVEYTDTFGGEANYSWVTRETFEAPAGASTRTLVHRAKAALGLVGYPCRTSHLGNMIKIVPARSCTVIFVTWE